MLELITFLMNRINLMEKKDQENQVELQTFKKGAKTNQKELAKRDEYIKELKHRLKKAEESKAVLKSSDSG